MLTELPELGQLVEVRRRQWVVMNIQPSSPALGEETPRQNLLTLASIDEDAMGESLAAVWELEPGARILDVAELPKINGFDPCERLEAFLDAVRWGATTNADRSLLQSPFRSGIEIQDFQLDPLVRAIDMARVNLLIADDVGLGKTIEAGLVIQEMIVRHRARTVFIVCPASLQTKWRNEMHEKFGLEFRIVDTEYIKALRRERGIHANPWSSFPRLITSMDWMKSGEGLRLIKDIVPLHTTYPRKFDILVIDEAHNVAPSAASRYALPSQRTKLIRTIAPHFEHRLFLSATPHNGYPESFTSLLELLDDQRFARGVMPEEKVLQRVMVRRLKTDLVDEHGEPIYAQRELLPLAVEYTDEEREVHALLKEYTAERSKAVVGTKAAFGSDFIHKLLKKRLFSSPMAFSTTLAKHRQSLSNRSGNQKPSEMKERILRKAILRSEEEYADDVQVEEAQDEAIEAATELTTALTDAQRNMLARMTAWADKAKNRSDSKAEAILSWLDESLKTDGQPNDARVILFTEYRATHSWLMQILATSGWGGERLMALHGGTDPEEREKIKAAFQTHPSISPVRILLATDAASEGIDLQNYCNYLIHIEIPWNPNVMEQRNGRIDRHGQKQKKVFVWHPVGAGTVDSSVAVKPGDLVGDHEFLMRAVKKVDSIRQDLGCVGAVITSQIEEAMLGRRVEMDTREAEDRAANVRKFVAAEKRLQERIAKLHDRLLEARENYQLTPDRVVRAVDVALQLAGKPALEPTSLDGQEGKIVYRVPLLTGSWDQATYGLAHPHTGTRRPITFDHSLAQGRDDVVLTHLQHKLVQMSLRLLRAEIWAQEDRKKLQRVAVRVVPEGRIDDPVVIVWSRLVITGGGHHRLHEELTMAGGDLKLGGFSRIRTLRRLEELLEASSPTQPAANEFSEFQKRFSDQKPSIMKAIEARSRERREFLSNAIERRRDQEVADLNQVLDDLTKMIERELKDSNRHVQLELWPTDQQEALRRDIESLRLRLQRIPEEREREVENIRRRYADPIDRTFPVAVEFIVPASFMEGR
ncbi:DISARM system SNF2-like helicase DrmD [Botrimarina sp.]|uniref:DISARM system SNF2-like helicase DrmD n=1 Tax=Botrimarina sp. TaxID=2795802 RepID=UPI0032ECF61D